MDAVAKLPCPDCGCDPCECQTDVARAFPLNPYPAMNGALLSGLPHGALHTAEPETVRVRYRVEYVLVPTLILDPCKCGRDRRTQHGAAVAMARERDELPPVACSCGRTVIGTKARVIEAVQ